MEPRWLSRRTVDFIHGELIREHGGAAGTRAGGDGLIESALMRPRNRFVYEPDSDLATLAASYLFGFAKNHAYVDGNKRVAFAAATTFLKINGRRLIAAESDAYDAVIAVTESRISESELAKWIRANCETPRAIEEPRTK